MMKTIHIKKIGAATPGDLASAAKNGVEAADGALNLYNKYLDQLIPWGLFKETIQKLHQAVNHLSDEAGQLVGEIKTLLLNGMDEYHSSTEKVFEWCDLASRRLKKYLELFDRTEAGKDRIIEAQKTILIKVLDDGINFMTVSQEKLHQASTSFNSASGKLTTLNQKLQHDLQQNSAYFDAQVAKIRTGVYSTAWIGGLIPGYTVAAIVVEGKLIPNLKKDFEMVKHHFESLKETVSKADVNITDTKKKLQDEIVVIGKLKTDTKDAKNDIDDLGEFREFIEISVSKLIESCDEYMKRHSSKM